MKKFYASGRILLAASMLFTSYAIAQSQCGITCGTGANGAYTASSNSTIAGGTYNFTSFTINAGVTLSVTGNSPLVIYCTGMATISGTLTVTGGNGTNGVTFSTNGIGGVAVAGGYNGGDGVFSASSGPLDGIDGSGSGGVSDHGAGWSGGGGAGYAASGSSSGGATGGFGGPSYGNAQVTPLDGGSGGGGGSGGYSCGSGGGGAGGGVIEISACGGILINAGGAILANGGNGGSDGTGNCGGGGGGSGGTIFLAASSVTNNGMISAVGGTGGASAIPGNPYYGTGANGSNGRVRIDNGFLAGSGSINPASAYNGYIITSTITSTNVTCFGSCNGTATVNPTGGTSPYTYAWAPGGATTQSVTGLCAGSYTCTVTDANGCITMATVTITQPPAIVVAITSTPLTCNGICDGTASATATGGTGAYSYLWSPSGGMVPNASGLCSGSYTCTVTDANGCVGQQTVNITQPPAITIAFPQVINNMCNGQCNAAITANASGGTGSFTYLWSTSQTSQTVTGLCAGNYSVQATDANGCTATQTISIIDPAPLAVNTTTVSTTCGLCNGSATVTPSGGTAPYSYTWSDGNSSSTDNNMCAGTYTIQVTDANGCTITTTIVIANSSGPVATPTINNITCNGACDGNIIENVQGGTGPFSFMWAPTGGTTATASNLCAGCYTVTVTDANGCVFSDSVCLTEPTAVVATATSTDASTSTSNDGTLSGNASGGTPGYTFIWQPGNMSGANQTNIGTGSYTLTVCDMNNCCDTSVAMVADIGSVQTVLSATNVSVYPNPANATVHISFSLISNAEVKLEVFNALGEKVDAVQLTNSSDYTYSTAKLANGMYSFRFTANGETLTKKITIAH